jgi:hypothetical protein
MYCQVNVLPTNDREFLAAGNPKHPILVQELFLFSSDLKKIYAKLPGFGNLA